MSSGSGSGSGSSGSASAGSPGVGDDFGTISHEEEENWLSPKTALCYRGLGYYEFSRSRHPIPGHMVSSDGEEWGDEKGSAFDEKADPLAKAKRKAEVVKYSFKEQEAAEGSKMLLVQLLLRDIVGKRLEDCPQISKAKDPLKEAMGMAFKHLRQSGGGTLSIVHQMEVFKHGVSTTYRLLASDKRTE